MKKDLLNILLFIIAVGLLIACVILFHFDKEIFVMLCSWFGIGASVCLLIMLVIENCEKDKSE